MNDKTADNKLVSEHITQYTYMDSPIGALLLAGCEKGLRLVGFETGSQARQPLENWTENKHAFQNVKDELDGYFSGTRQEFSSSILLEGTPFQNQVWQALRNVPYGRSASYGDIAKSIGNPKASRAVGGANNANPIPIIIPCHRIIGANKSLVGFGGGLKIKKFLLDLEAKHGVFPDRLL